MKRSTAAALAAATAISLAAAPAQAQDLKPIGHSRSSDVTEAEMWDYLSDVLVAEKGSKGAGIASNYGGSSVKGLAPTAAEAVKEASPALSSFQNDANRGYKLGTTWDILVGTGIALSVLAVLGAGAAYAGVIPGVQLPALPF